MRHHLPWNALRCGISCRAFLDERDALYACNLAPADAKAFAPVLVAMKCSKAISVRDTRGRSTSVQTHAARADSQLSFTLQRLLLGLAQHLLRVGITPSYFGDLATQAFVRAAAQISKCRNGRVNSSRVAVLTSLRRAEVKRLLTASAEFETTLSKRQPRTQRVLAGWRTDRRYLDRRGLPRRLPMHGRSGSFASLVKAFAGDVPPRAVLDELRRLRAVRELGHCIELASERVPRDRYLFRSVQGLMEVLLGDLEAAPCGPTDSSARLQRILLKAADVVDLKVMQERASVGADEFLEGLQRSLEFPTMPPRRSKGKMKHQLAVTVVVTARPSKHSSNKQ